MASASILKPGRQEPVRPRGRVNPMPIYEYVCDTCGKEFEVMQKFSDKPLTRCTCSKSGRVKRKLSAPSFHLQGGGWYNEGYSAKKDSAKSEAKSEAKPADSSAAKSDAKSGASSGAASEGSGKEGSGKKAESKGAKSESKGSAHATA
jgi:putative FmdB family regulatory protein